MHLRSVLKEFSLLDAVRFNDLAFGLLGKKYFLQILASVELILERLLMFVLVSFPYIVTLFIWPIIVLIQPL